MLNLLVILVALSWFPTHAASQSLILEIDFEDQTFGRVNRIKGSDSRKTDTGYASICCNHSLSISRDIRRHGKYGSKFVLNSNDAGFIYGKRQDPARRAELEKNGVAHVGDTRWYGFSVNIDASWKDTTRDPNGTIIAQWHTNKDKGEVTKSPHFSIAVMPAGTWKLESRWDAKAISTKNGEHRRLWKLNKVAKGKWTDWVIFAKWSYKSDGVLKVWQNGKLVVDHRGPNVYNDKNKEFFKFGVYKAWWKHEQPKKREQLIAYFDEVRIGDHRVKFEDVAPRGSRSSPDSRPAPPRNLKIEVVR